MVLLVRSSLCRRRTGQQHRLIAPSVWLRRSNTGAQDLCSCSNSPPGRLSICWLLPRHRFGSSRFNTVFLLVLRLFYHASSFGVTRSSQNQDHVLQQARSNLVTGGAMGERATSTPVTLPAFLQRYQRSSTQDFLEMLEAQPDEMRTCRVSSITWVKALASPFSHEFLQFIVEDASSGQRTRVAAGREETGDWVHVGWNWASGDTPSDHYKLPLPLLSLTFDEPGARPDLLRVARVLAATTQRQPYYKFRREMCWWYAETVLEELSAHGAGRIEEWAWSRYRYSFVVKTSIIPRTVLTQHAEAFKQRLAQQMDY